MNKTKLLSCEELLEIFSTSHIATAIYTTDDLVIEAATQAMLSFWGRSRDIIGLPLEVAVPELIGQPFAQQMKNALKTGITYNGKSVPAQLLDKGKLSTFYYDYEYRPVKNANGDVICLLHHATDVTERVLGEMALANEEQQRQMLERELALNEELAAANEELAAINEELHQTQTELNALNAELEERIHSRTIALEQSEGRLRYIIDDAPVAIAVLSGRNMVIEAANQYMLRIWGKPATVVGQNLIDALPELREQVFISLLENVFDTGESFTGNEARVFLEYEGNLEERFVNFVYKAMKSEAGQVHSIMVVANDVTEQVLARKAVEAARHRLEAMVTTTPIAMTILKGRDLIIEQANAAMYQIWQRNSTQTIGKKLIDVFPELIGQPFPDLLANVFETGEKVAFPEMPVNIAFPDGTSKDIFVNFSYDPLFDLDGEVEAILASVSDITERVEARLKLEKSEQELQIATEELAAANEELTAINEEMMASNEELASTNEELISTQDHLHNTIEQLNESKERFSFLLNSIPQQIWTATVDGALDYVNDVVCSDFGYNKDEVVGHGWQKFIHPDDLPKALEKWTHALENGNEYLIEFRLLFADGIYRWHLGRAVPLIENGEIQLWLGSNTNIDLQKTNEQKKDEFLSIASHELKTPLTSIKAFNQMLKRGAMPDTLKGFVQKSADNIQRLEKLIADLLDVTKMNSGKLEYDMQPFNFKKLLVESAENTRYLSSSHEVVLKNAADVQIVGDNVRLEQVLNNFLSNAVKYSPKGEQVIIDSWVEGQQVIVSVQDFGIGIAPSHIDKLFDRYYRVDNTAMRFEGLGLGLFISSEILKRHGGKVWIESEQDKGSTFYFSLPLAAEQVEHQVAGIPINLTSAETDLA